MLKNLAALIGILSFSSCLMAQNKVADSTVVKNLIAQCDSIEFTQPHKALKLYDKAYGISIKGEYYEGAFKAALYSGSVHNNLAQYDSAFYFFDKASSLSLKTDSKTNEALVYLKKANTYMFQGNLDESLKNHFEGIKYLESVQDEKRLIAAYANASAVFGQLDDYDKQIVYLKKSLAVTPEDNYKDLALSYGDIGLTFLNKRSYEEAFVNFKKSDSISKLTESPTLDFFVTRNWGEYYGFIDNCTKAIPYFERALQLARAYNYTYYEKDLILNLGECHMNTGNLNTAETYLQEAYNVGKKLGVIEIPKKALILLSELNGKRRNYEKANQYLKEHITLKDSLINDTHVKNINELEAKYESEKKDKEILAQNLALEKSQSKTQIMTILIITLLLASILLWFLFQQRQKRIQQQLISIQKQQEVLTLESLIAGEEKERLRIAQELHDGVNGDLSAIKFKLSSLLKMNNEVINEAVSMIDNSCQQVRAISHNLVPPSLQDFNLQEAIANYCENMDNTHKPTISSQHIGDVLDFNKKAEVNILRIAQELVTNAIKHAQATEITVQTSMQEGTMQLSLEDNGVGYDVNLENSNGIGLQNIKSRVAYLGGDIDVVSNKNGTEYTITFNPDNAS